MPHAVDKFINAQMLYWKRRKDQLEEPVKSNRLPFITISREYGCCGYSVAEKLVQILNDEMNPDPQWAAYDKKLIEKLMADTGLSESLIETLTGKARNRMAELIQTTFSSFPPQVSIHKKLTETIALLALNGHVVLVGRGSNLITKNFSAGFHIRLVAPINVRIEKISRAFNISGSEASRLIAERTKHREGYMKEYFKIELSDPHNYDLVINDGEFNPDQVSRLIMEGMRQKGLLS